MSRRIEVELTSQRDDGTWTWRAAGAKQPKGTLEGALLYAGASVGDVCRVDADVEIDGIFVTAVSPLKSRSGRPEDEKIEVLGSGRDFDAVTTQLTRKPRSDKGKGRRRKTDTKAARERPDKKSKRQQGRDKPESRKPRKPSKAKGEVPAKPKPKKLKPKRVHRQAFIESLPEEQRVIAEQVSRGGIAAVRKEIEAQNARAAEEGSEEVRADALVTLAESLLPQLKIAEWRDRADAALSSMEEVDIRDLRTVLVAAEDAARDEESRLLADQIRVGLKARVEKAQVEWHDEIRAALKDERVVRALRLSSRPPKAGSPLPPDIAETLTAQANQALGGDVSQQRLGIVLEAIAFSPIRPYIALAHLPAEPGAELLEVVQKIADRIPEIALRFGIEPRNKRKGRKKPRPKSVQNKNGDDEQASEDQHPSASQEADQAPSEPEASPDIKAEAPPDIEVATDQAPDGSPDKELHSDQHP
ncbi:MAG: hypothetical protein VYE75_04105 [Actinomycetota bacterium]|jgi:hypothetical protein|nr:hypothetical protein [Actinomycetota bacterium]